MLFYQVEWLRENRLKLCSTLKKRVLAEYKPIKFIPCFLQDWVYKLKRKLHKHKVIIQFDPLVRNAGSLRTLSSILGFKANRELDIINAVSAELSTEKLEKVAQHKSVVKVWYDYEVRALLNIAAPTVGAPDLWQSPGEVPYTGAGVTVAVIDTGIYPHPDLAGRVTYFKDFVNNKTEAYDDNGHGTHVAGCVAGNGSCSAGKFRGTAPGANLIGLRVLGKYGSGSLSTIIHAVQWCRDNREQYNIKVANLSLGGAAEQSYKDDPLCQAVEELWRSGVVVCAAAGNEGPDNNTIGSPAIDPIVITVGATNDFNSTDISDDEVADFSSRGPTVDGLAKPDLVTPGTNIISLRSPGSHLDRSNNVSRYDDNYTVLSGTSMATPICAGVAALLLEVKPDLSPDQVKEILISSSRPFNQYTVNDQGAGLVDAAAALKLVPEEQPAPTAD
ncbi:Serine protease AprX [Sporotomaculum syntrophicum]|uniref:Serine protease AprX n=1 Tax=Sporotomaculum syntrophicum TaxID=182264 RepID=A0A9D3AYN9_9FIRM|nr:S8 family peptidase [Sporotomaculum syntrophicum]KAF1086277.1 Serine protease AprX [Sporotomaculum syntrophicum]